MKNPAVADISVLEGLQVAQHERFARGGMGVFNLTLTEEHTEFRSNLRKPRVHVPKNPAKLGALQAKIAPAEKVYRERFAELSRLRKAASFNPNTKTDPAKVMQYTGVKPGDPKWDEAVRKYRTDLRTKTEPKYAKAAKEAYDHLRKAVLDWHRACEEDRREAGSFYSVFSDNDFQRQYRHPNFAGR